MRLVLRLGCILLLGTATADAQGARTRNVVLIVPDGVRWQEVFSGAERALISRLGGVSDTTAILREFWRDTPDERREVLFPFLWGTVATQGQIIGDSSQGSTAAVTNGLKFSYPGYNEMLSGAPDPKIRSNSFGPNPNRTVFEWLATRPGFEGKVSAFATWGAFRDIFNIDRAKVRVHAGWRDPFPQPANDRQRTINELHRKTTPVWPDNTLDVHTHLGVMEHIRSDKPRVLFVGYGETDEWQHAGRYDLLLMSARQMDGYIAELWNTMQAMPEYRGTTTFIITTDHGRGDGLAGWKNHGEDVVGAERIWMAMIGPDTPAGGFKGHVTQSQVAATLAALLGEDWVKASPAAAKPVPWARD